MATVYGICLLVGGVLVFVTVFMGGDADADVDADVDLDADIDVDVDADADFDADGDVDGSADIKGDVGGLSTGIWLPFFSLRFWIFGTAFFGLTGVLLTLLAPYLQLQSDLLISLLSAGLGLSIGAASAYAFKWLKHSESNSLVQQKHYIGRTATVTLPVDADSKGKIVLEFGNQHIDFIAETDDPNGFQKGDRVTVIEVHEGIARVIQRPPEFEPLPEPKP